MPLYVQIVLIRFRNIHQMPAMILTSGCIIVSDIKIPPSRWWHSRAVTRRECALLLHLELIVYVSASWAQPSFRAQRYCRLSTHMILHSKTVLPKRKVRSPISSFFLSVRFTTALTPVPPLLCVFQATCSAFMPLLSPGQLLESFSALRYTIFLPYRSPTFGDPQSFLLSTRIP